MRYKINKIVFGIAVFFGLATASAHAETVTLKVWSMPGHDWGSEEAQLKIVSEFEALNPDIKIDLTLLPERGFKDRVNTALGSGSNVPDVFPLRDEWRPMTMDLAPFVKADPDINPDMYYGPVWRTRAMAAGKNSALPVGLGVNIVLYNKDVFDAAGVDYPSPDWTTEDYIKLTKAISDPSKGVWGGDRTKDAFRAIWHNYDAQVYSDDSTTVDGYYNSPQSLAAFEWYWDLVNKGGTPKPSTMKTLGTEGTGPVDLFIAGRLGMATLNPTHMLRALREGVNFGVLPEPAGPSKERHANVWSGSLGMFGETRHPEAAWKYMSFVAGIPGQRITMNGETKMFPSIPSLWDEHEHIDFPGVKIAQSMLEWPIVRDFDGSHMCWRAAVRRVDKTFELIGLDQLKRDEIKASLDSEIPTLQQALDDCVPRLGN